jgi:hypothetical protein
MPIDFWGLGLDFVQHILSCAELVIRMIKTALALQLHVLSCFLGCLDLFVLKSHFLVKNQKSALKINQ